MICKISYIPASSFVESLTVTLRESSLRPYELALYNQGIRFLEMEHESCDMIG